MAFFEGLNEIGHNIEPIFDAIGLTVIVVNGHKLNKKSNHLVTLTVRSEYKGRV